MTPKEIKKSQIRAGIEDRFFTPGLLNTGVVTTTRTRRRQVLFFGRRQFSGSVAAGLLPANKWKTSEPALSQPRKHSTLVRRCARALYDMWHAPLVFPFMSFVRAMEVVTLSSVGIIYLQFSMSGKITHMLVNSTNCNSYSYFLTDYIYIL